MAVKNHLDNLNRGGKTQPLWTTSFPDWVLDGAKGGAELSSSKHWFSLLPECGYSMWLAASRSLWLTFLHDRLWIKINTFSKLLLLEYFITVIGNKLRPLLLIYYLFVIIACYLLIIYYRWMSVLWLLSFDILKCSQRAGQRAYQTHQSRKTLRLESLSVLLCTPRAYLALACLAAVKYLLAVFTEDRETHDMELNLSPHHEMETIPDPC